jgi:hypothetical protein
MTAKTDFLENELLDHALAVGAFTMPTAIDVSLHTASPTDTGSVAAEVSGGLYARQAVTFGAAVGGTSSNTGIVTFPTATAPWGTVTHIGLHNNTGGTMLYYGALTTSKVVDTGDTVSFAASALTVSES